MAELCLIEVNNFLVGMRPKVDRARVQVIHKLTRQSGQLKNKKTNDNDAHKDKNSRKAQRLVQEVLILKKMKKQEMAKFALSNTRAFMTDIPNPETTDEETMLDLLQVQLVQYIHVRTMCAIQLNASCNTNAFLFSILHFYTSDQSVPDFMNRLSFQNLP